MSIELYNNNGHVNISFPDLVKDVASVQSNQFLIVNDGHAALIDPGGELTYNGLYMAVSNYVKIKDLDYVLASHQDPDIVASINRWLSATNCKLVCPEIWDRFIPHFTRPGKMDGRLISVPDQGANIPIGKSIIKAIPAHFMHSEGNFHFYDPLSKILFSGDMGANINSGDLDTPFSDISEALPFITGFHERYMNSNRVCRYWANMIRTLDVEWMVPQHGRSFKGKKVIGQFLSWIEQLECGTDLMTQKDYRVI